MNQIRIATGGKAGAGKDFILNILVQYHARLGSWAERPIAIAGFRDLIKADWRESHGIEGTRQDWQNWGQRRRQEDERYWLKAASRWASYQHEDAVVGFSGVRFLNEINYLQRHGFEVGLVQAPYQVRIQRLFQRDGRVWSDEELSHPTETGLDLIPASVWDFVINND